MNCYRVICNTYQVIKNVDREIETWQILMDLKVRLVSEVIQAHCVVLRLTSIIGITLLMVSDVSVKIRFKSISLLSQATKK